MVPYEINNILYHNHYSEKFLNSFATSFIIDSNLYNLEVPDDVRQHPAFNNHDFLKLAQSEILELEKELMKVAHEMKPDHSIYFLRPSSIEGIHDRQIFSMIYIHEDGLLKRTRVAYQPSTGNWLLLSLDGKEVLTRKTCSLNEMITMILKQNSRYDAKISPLEEEFYNEVKFAIDQKKRFL